MGNKVDDDNTDQQRIEQRDLVFKHLTLTLTKGGEEQKLTLKLKKILRLNSHDICVSSDFSLSLFAQRCWPSGLIFSLRIVIVGDEPRLKVCSTFVHEEFDFLDMAIIKINNTDSDESLLADLVSFLTTVELNV